MSHTSCMLLQKICQTLYYTCHASHTSSSTKATSKMFVLHNAQITSRSTNKIDLLCC